MKELTGFALNISVHLDKYSEKREQYVQRMLNEGNTIYYPDERELLIDIDSEESFEKFREVYRRFCEELDNNGWDIPNNAVTVSKSKTEGHFHISVIFPWKLDLKERMLYQLLLGSDPVREMLSLFRFWRGDNHPTLLCRKEGGE